MGGENPSSSQPTPCISGLIPAWAGKTREASGHAHRPGAHPRVGGENRERPGRGIGAGGSSPRGRGKQANEDLRPAPLGLIPAWAGKTRLSNSIPIPCRAHPRVGGENIRSFGGYFREAGSSPRGRGKRRWPGLSRRGAGLIPAWAGKTCFSFVEVRGAWAHPRVGGENTKKADRSKIHRGSSPRGRGKRADE